MIAVTLQFKNLEAARAALLEIPTSSLVGEPDADEAPAKKPASAASGQRTAKADAPAKTASAPAPAAASAEAAAPASTAATAPQETAADPKPAAEPSAPAAPAASPASSPAPVEYPVLQKAVFTLAGKDKAAAMAIAAEMGVKTFKDLPADRWAEALAAVNAKIAELG